MRPAHSRAWRPPLAPCHAVAWSSWLASMAALVLTVSLGSTCVCRADGLVLSAPNLTAASGSSGSFDVLLTNTNPAGGASYEVAVDAFQLGLSGPAGVTFTDVSINTLSAPYIYVTSGTTQGG